MTEKELVNTARLISRLAHKGQTDRAGKPYARHPEKVASFLADPAAQCVAYLHDVLEDTDVTREELQKIFGDRITDAVWLLTRPAHMEYMDYIRRLKENPLARSVKLADLRHNMDLSRIPNPSTRDRERVEKYKAARALLLQK